MSIQIIKNSALHSGLCDNGNVARSLSQPV
jgi:hypothetical protein